MSTNSWDDARKSYLTSLRARLKKAYAQEANSDSTPDKRWVNGFMAAGFHSGLVTLKELKLENVSAYRKVYGETMSDPQEARLQHRLTTIGAAKKAF